MKQQIPFIGQEDHEVGAGVAVQQAEADRHGWGRQRPAFELAGREVLDRVDDEFRIRRVDEGKLRPPVQIDVGGGEAGRVDSC